jgi:hypothetical protein
MVLALVQPCLRLASTFVRRIIGRLSEALINSENLLSHFLQAEDCEPSSNDTSIDIHNAIGTLFCFSFLCIVIRADSTNSCIFS